MKYLAYPLTAVLAMILTARAIACGPEDLAGTWRTFSISFYDTAASEACKLDIKSDGRLRVGTVCKLRTSDNVKARVLITGGRFRINENCRVFGILRSKTGTAKIEAWLSQNGQILTGTANGRGIVLLFTGVKSLD